MSKGKKIRISQCMIVKNEEKNIRRALSWGRKMMWEQIVVDTGSTDRTAEIAREMGAKVFFFQWMDDFAAAKNYALDQAKGDWIAFLDADEYMTPEGVERMEAVFQQIAGRDFDGISTGLQDLDDEGAIAASGTQVRFFRNHPDIRYRRRIHENLVSLSGRKLYLGDVAQEVSIFHTGYQTEAMAGKKKSRRNQELLLKELEEHPADYEIMGYLGDDCMSSGEKKEAIAWFRKSFQHMPAAFDYPDQRSAVTLNTLLSLLLEELREGRESMPEKERKELQEEIQSTYQRAVTLWPEESDFDYTMGCSYALAGQIQEGIRHLELAIQKLDEYGCSGKALVLAANLIPAYSLLARCCREAGESEKCASYAVQCLKYQRYEMGVLADLIQVLIPKDDGAADQYSAIAGFLSKLYDFSSLKDPLFLIKAAAGAERKEFMTFLADCFFSKEQQKQFGLL